MDLEELNACKNMGEMMETLKMIPNDGHRTSEINDLATVAANMSKHCKDLSNIRYSQLWAPGL